LTEANKLAATAAIVFHTGQHGMMAVTSHAVTDYQTGIEIRPAGI